MRIRKLVAQKKICPTLSCSTSTPTTIAERVNNYLQKKKEEVVVCELNMSVWEVIPYIYIVIQKERKINWFYIYGGFRVLNNEEKNDDKITDESVNAEEDQIRNKENDNESEEDDDEETEEEELEEKQYAMVNKRKLGLKSVTKDKKKKRDYHDDSDDYEEEKKKRVVYCCKTDRKGWHCRSKAQMGNPLCKRHMIQMQHYSDDQRDNNYHRKKIRKLEKKTARRGRPPNEYKTAAASTTTIRGRRNKGKLSGKKSSEFYYYSGFGPLWGKNNRGRPPNEVKKQKQDVKEEERQVIDEALIIHRTSPKMSIVKQENVNYDNGCMFFDDDDFDDDSDEDCNGVNVKRRYRKPIKAISLAPLF
ncbi:hypothetical protein MKX01_005132 [Papaver californicum]|nr:hypothetical protein MKX01_005132 [Papaver californicum]